MSAGHGGIGGLAVHGHSRVHRLAPETKVAATLAFVLTVVVTPRAAFWAFGLYLVLVFVAARAAGLGPRLIATRLRIEVPFVAFAIFLPFVGEGPDTEVLGLSLSEPGLWGAWSVLAKATLGVLAAVVLSATTPPAELLEGLERLRVPRPLTAIGGFMVRYLDVIVDESRRIRLARLSRGDDPHWLWQSRAIAAGAGTLFVRSYERGERVFLAMQSRGYDGSMPPLRPRRTTAAEWLIAASIPVAAAGVALAALVT